MQARRGACRRGAGPAGLAPFGAAALDVHRAVAVQDALGLHRPGVVGADHDQMAATTHALGIGGRLVLAEAGTCQAAEEPARRGADARAGQGRDQPAGGHDRADARDSQRAQAGEQSGAAAVMIGRGAQGQPWAVGQIGAQLGGREPEAAPIGAELAALVAEHYDAMLTDYGTQLGVRVARKHLDWYLEAANIGLDKPVRSQLLNELEPTEVTRMIADIYSGDWRLAA